MALWSVEIEQQVLGCLLNAGIAGHASALRHPSPEDFHDPVHQRIFAACMRRLSQDGSFSATMIAHDLEDDEGLQSLGGHRYLGRLAGSVMSSLIYPDYVAQLRALAAKRHLMATLEQGIADLQDPERDAAAVAASVEAAIIARGEETGAEIISLSDAVKGAIEATVAAQEADGVSGVPTGFPALDEITGGFHPGELVLLGGRPSMGKSALALSIATSAARAGRTVAYASLEMSAQSLALRAISEESARSRWGVEYTRARRGDMSEEEAECFFQSGIDLGLAKLPIEMIPSNVRDIGALMAASRRVAVQAEAAGRPLAMLIVDYLQLLRSPKPNRYEQMTEVSMQLKALAMRLDIPVLALSQLSRGVEQRDDKRPSMSDLRETGQLEQDADVIMFCYRPEYYLERKKPDDGDMDRIADWERAMSSVRGRLDVIVAKQRMGEVGTVHLGFTPRFNEVREWRA